jgi:hypothetical protein
MAPKGKRKNVPHFTCVAALVPIQAQMVGVEPNEKLEMPVSIG